MVILLTVLGYFAVLLGISRLTSGRADNDTFYRARRRAPWYMVAFGMVGASISGVTFVSVPGMVLSSQMTYLQVCLGFIVGYAVVAFLLLPLYYRLNLTSIYAYLGQRLGHHSYQTGAWFFLLSKMTGSAVKFYVVCMILQRFVFDPAGIPFVVNVSVMVLLIWLYTRRGGIGTLVFTDTFQTLCLFTALVLIILEVVGRLNLSPGEAIEAVAGSPMSRVFVFDDWLSSHNFWKQFLSGVFIVIVMTGLDQDMMQKNLTCKTLRDAQKDMCSYGVAFVPANLLFLSLGVLLTMVSGTALKGDELLPAFVQDSYASHHSLFTMLLFTIGIVAASFSSADSALTALTTCYCVDIRHQPADERLRKRVHLGMCLCFVLFILLFRATNSTSLIDAIYILVSYTYGPLLGLFAFGLFTRRQPCDRLVPCICIASPLLCYALDTAASHYLDYHFGYELLMLNGLLTFLGLWLSAQREAIDRIWAAFIFFTRLPFWRLHEPPSACFRTVVEHWPLAGWLTGGAMAAVLYFGSGLLPWPVVVLLAIIVRLLLTGALHEDGLADFLDGFGGGGSDRQRILTIMKDSHIGTYGVLGLIAYELLLFFCLSSLSPEVAALTVLAADPYSKMVASQLIVMMPYARREEEAKAKTVYRKIDARAGISLAVQGLLPMAAFIWLTSVQWETVIFIPALVMYFLYLLIWRRLHGYTGDCCGAVCLLVELAVYLVVCSQAITVNGLWNYN